eukprot:6977272-Heterocapsa_arctica.AAC.1
MGAVISLRRCVVIHCLATFGGDLPWSSRCGLFCSSREMVCRRLSPRMQQSVRASEVGVTRRHLRRKTAKGPSCGIPASDAALATR